MGVYDDCERCNGGKEHLFENCDFCNEYKSVCDCCGYCQECGHYQD